MNADAVNDFATYLALSGAVPATLAFFTFVLGKPRTWPRSLIGWTLALLLVSIMLVFTLVLGRRLFGEYPGYQYTAIIVYALLTVALWLVFVMIVRERRRGRALGFVDIPGTTSRKAPPMTNAPITTATVPPIWYKAQRVLRTVFTTVLTVLPLIPQVIAIIQGQWDATWLTAVAAQAVAINAALTAFIAIPAVNAFLTRFGLGSVPRSAVVNGEV